MSVNTLLKLKYLANSNVHSLLVLNLSLLLASDSVPLVEQTLRSFQSRLIKQDASMRVRASKFDHQIDQAFYMSG